MFLSSNTIRVNDYFDACFNRIEKHEFNKEVQHLGEFLFYPKCMGNNNKHLTADERDHICALRASGKSLVHPDT